MDVRLLGVQNVSFTASNGDRIEGTNLFCSFTDENVQGEKVAKFFLKKGIPLPKDIRLNTQITVLFDMHGRIEAVNTVK